MKSTAYIDLDGTVLDTKKRHYAAYTAILKRHGCNPLGIRSYWNLKTAATPNAEILKRTKAQHIAKQFQKEWLQEIEKKGRLKLDSLAEKAREGLKALSQFRLVLVTLRQSRKSLLRQLKLLGIKGCFDAVLSGHPKKTQPWKQKAGLIRKDIKKGNRAAFMIGDTEADIKAAKKLKIPAIATTSGMRRKELLLRLKPEFTATQLNKAATIAKKWHPSSN
ncbi:HAD family hydrolase [Candidatus Woesearchaeota archaeon]|nr:HAD family hydrolase [Candidatus Woesearchaeota archaeon]